MKKLLLLVPLLFLCSCGNNNISSGSIVYNSDVKFDYYKIGETDDNGVRYNAYIDLHGGTLCLSKTTYDKNPELVKQWVIGKYQVVSYYYTAVYDYGDTALFYSSIL